MMVCTSIIAQTFETISAQIDPAEMVELRLDQCNPSPEQLVQIAALLGVRKCPWVATFRVSDGHLKTWTDPERLVRLKQAIDLGATFVDIEIESDPDYRTTLTRYAQEKHCQVIISYHNFSETPVFTELQSLVEQALEMQADLVKLITTSIHPTDNAKLLRLYETPGIDPKRLIAFGMGTLGSPTRWQCLTKGAPFTYASAVAGAEAAPGQLTAKSIALALTPALFGIMGKPVGHSMSPMLFRAAFSDYPHWHFLRIAAQDAKEGVQVMRELKLRGMNVTAPFKTEVLEYVDIVTESAKKMGAANTLVMDEDGKIAAHNTDHLGVLGALKDFKVDGTNKRCLILGAGGAARAAAYAMQSIQAQTVILNRTGEHAQALAQTFGLDWVEYGKLDPQALKALVHKSDIIINTLPTGIQLIPEAYLEARHVVLDASYHDSVYFSASLSQKYHFISGLYWLLHQGIPAYTLFTGIRPEAGPMENELLSLDQAPIRNFSFIGLMGSGKSTAAYNLSKRFGMKLLDTDRMLEEYWGKKITEVVEAHGIAYLRKEEAAKIPLWLEAFEGMFSCGGGVVTQECLRKQLKALSYPIWLYARPQECLDRISDLNTRPLLAHADDPTVKIEALAQERFPLYVETAELLVPVGGKQKEEVTERIALEIENLITKPE